VRRGDGGDAAAIRDVVSGAGGRADVRRHGEAEGSRARHDGQRQRGEASRERNG